MTELYFNFNDVILILSIGLSLILAIFQTILSTKTKFSNYLLAAFFLSITISNIGVMLLWNEYLPKSPSINQLTPYLYSFSMLIKGPLLVMYVASITLEDFRIKKRYLYHLLPSILVFMVIISFNIDIDLMRLDTVGIERYTYLATDLVWWSLKLVPLMYFVYGLYSVYQYHKSIMFNNSAINETALIWLYLLTMAYVGAELWSVAVSLLALMYRLPFGITDNYLNFGLLIAIFYYSASYAQKLTLTKSSKNKNTQANDNLEQMIESIMQGIKQQKLYLNQSINIEQFSDKINLPQRDVSFAINRAFNTNFFEFINSYRIEEAKSYLSNKQYDNMTIMDILLESGFNSKSSFQRFFKRLVGMSPSEFRSQAQASSNR